MWFFMGYGYDVLNIDLSFLKKITHILALVDVVFGLECVRLDLAVSCLEDGQPTDIFDRGLGSFDGREDT